MQIKLVFKLTNPFVKRLKIGEYKKIEENEIVFKKNVKNQLYR